jgi:hypothetical protein
MRAVSRSTPSPTIVGLPGDELVYNENEAFFEGSFHELKLTGAYVGQAWGAH